MGAYIPPCGNVASGVIIRISNKTTVCTTERFAVPYSNVQTLRASLGGVCRRDSNNIHSCKFSFVFKEAAELGEWPRVGSAPKSLIAFLPIGAIADVGQILNGYAFVLALCLLDNLSLIV